MFTLRPYQEKAVDKAIEFFESNDSSKPMLVLPTGSGKSIIIAFITKQLKGQVLVLQPSKELLEQNYKKYHAITENNPELPVATVYSASVGVKQRGEITFATIGSIYKKAELFKDYKYILIDECHNVPPNNGKGKGKNSRASMYVKFLSELNSKVIGLTATPYRLKSYQDYFTQKKYSQINLLNRERPSFFNKFLYVVNLKEMYDGGYLCPVNYIEMKFDGSFLEFNSTGAEYTEESVKKAMTRNKVIDKIPGILDQAFKKEQNSCLVFVKWVSEAQRLASITPFSNYIHALTPKDERAKIIANFKKGNIKTLFNVSVLTEGFDYPELDTVIIARPTASLTLYTQMIGRGIRNAEGKEKCSVLDMCANLRKFGKIEDIRIEDDEKHGWVLRNNDKILSGKRIDELCS